MQEVVIPDSNGHQERGTDPGSSSIRELACGTDNLPPRCPPRLLSRYTFEAPDYLGDFGKRTTPFRDCTPKCPSRRSRPKNHLDIGARDIHAISDVDGHRRLTQTVPGSRFPSPPPSRSPEIHDRWASHGHQSRQRGEYEVSGGLEAPDSPGLSPSNPTAPWSRPPKSHSTKESRARRSGDGRRAAVDQPRGRLFQPSRLDIWQDSREVILEPVLERSDVVLLDLCQP
jgi:hypothetical protein